MIKLNQARFPTNGNFWIGAAIAGVASLVGGIMSSRSASKAAKANRQAQLSDMEKNLAYQKEFAQHGVEWTAESARRAGVDPAIAMGQSSTYYPTNYQPTNTGKDYSFIGQMGQDIKGAFSRTANKAQRELLALQLERAHLENDYALIRNIKAGKEMINMDTQAGPGMPNSVGPYGESDDVILNSSGRISHTPDQRTRSHRSNAGETAATQPFHTTWIDKDGRLRTTVQEKAGEVLESDLPAWAEQTALSGIDKVKSYFRRPGYPDRIPPRGHIWKWKLTPTGGYWFAVRSKWTNAQAKAHYNKSKRSKRSYRSRQRSTHSGGGAW